MIGFRSGTAVVALALLLTTGSATAATAAAPDQLRTASSSSSEWVPAPSQPFDVAAGVLCDSAIHGDILVDEVRKKTLSTYPDGSPHRELYVGRLIIRVTNVGTGAYYDADASGDAVFVYDPDGTVTWNAVGPTLVGFREGQGNLPRGFYLLDGVYRLTFSPDGHRHLVTVHGKQTNICPFID
jgi:hypothetical protein